MVNVLNNVGDKLYASNNASKKVTYNIKKIGACR